MKILAAFLIFGLLGCSVDHNVEDIFAEGQITVSQDIEGIKEVCEDLFLIEDYEAEKYRARDVAQCTLDNLLDFGIEVDEESLNELRELIEQEDVDIPEGII